MFGWGKKNKDDEAKDAFGQMQETSGSVTVTSSSSTTTPPAGAHLGPAGPAELGNILGALHDAMEESGGDPDKLRAEIKENLSERGIAADVQTSGDPTIVASTFGGLMSPEDQTLARLEKLGRLKAQGLLTDEEFAAQKARILGT
jgi:hypothetical protein